MNIERVYEIINNREICDVYYQKHPVWIQEIQNNVAKIGFMDLNEEKSIDISDLHEKNL